MSDTKRAQRWRQCRESDLTRLRGELEAARTYAAEVRELELALKAKRSRLALEAEQA